MKNYRTVEVPAIPATTKEELVYIDCDICHETIKHGNMFDVDEIKVEHKLGVCYPETSNGQTLSFDICEKCFNQKLIPWLESQGAKPTIEEWDY